MFATSDNGNVIWISFGGTDTSLKRSPNEFFLLLLHFLLITVDWIELRTVCPRQCGNRIFFCTLLLLLPSTLLLLLRLVIVISKEVVIEADKSGVSLSIFALSIQPMMLLGSVSAVVVAFMLSLVFSFRLLLLRPTRMVSVLSVSMQ